MYFIYPDWCNVYENSSDLPSNTGCNRDKVALINEYHVDSISIRQVKKKYGFRLLEY